MHNENNYYQVHPLMKKEMAEAVLQCKGDRTGFEFAKSVGMSTSMLSRLLNKNISNPLPFELLERIYENRAQNCSVEFDDLAKFNGLVYMENAKFSDYRHVKFEEENKRVMNIRNAITYELLSKGFSIQNVDEFELKKYYPLESTGCGRHIEYCINNEFIGIFFINARVSSGSNKYSRSSIVQRRCFEDYASWFLRDAWQPELFEQVKTTFVFIDENEMDLFLNTYKNASVNSNMSVMLMDSEKYTFVDEWSFGRTEI